MNAVQFGRWLSERRRACGWPSQRLLAEAAQQHTIVHQSGISEDFVSRLEAGHLAYPFRGTVRRRILLLAWLLCKTPRDLKSYVRAAGLSDLSDEENTQLHLLSEHLAALQTPPPLLLPPRPGRLKGREREIEQILHALNEPATHVVSLTGMPGVGKSALAHEALHLVASAENERLRRFPDGIATFVCTGRQGSRGLLSLLTEITALFSAHEQNAQGGVQRRPAQRWSQLPASSLSIEAMEVEAELASAMDRARAALANKRVLLLLDDLDPAFPLRQALDALLAQNAPTPHEQRAESGHEQRVILTTSQFVPAPALVSTRLHLQPLTEEAALALLAELVGEEFSERNEIFARQACAAIGYLPLAIESMATAVQAKGIPLTLVATHLMTHPLGGLLDAEEEISAQLEKALALLDQEMRENYILLAALGLKDFDLEVAAAVTSPRRLPLPELEPAEDTLERQAEPIEARLSFAHAAIAAEPSVPGMLSLGQRNRQKVLEMAYGEHIPELNGGGSAEQERERLVHLAHIAATLGQCVRYSLLELLPVEQEVSGKHGEVTSSYAAELPGKGAPLISAPENNVGYRTHMLLHVYARALSHTLPAERLEVARHNLLSYALTYADRHGDDIPGMERAGGLGVVMVGLELAWNEKRYDVVVRLVRQLLPLSGRMEGDEGERLLQKGLYASQQLHDQRAIIAFLDRLASLRCYRGDLSNARQMWEAALRIQESMDPAPGCWHPLVGLAHLAHIQGDLQAARHFSEVYVQQAERSGDHESIILARAKRAFYARLLGQKDLAHGDLLTSLRLIREFSLPGHPEHERELVEMEARTELARVEGDYPRAQAYVEAAITLLKELYDRYNVVDVLYDQAYFALQQGLPEAARKLAQQAAEAAMEAGVPHFYQNSIRLLQEI